MGRMVGYARVSTSDQDVSSQWAALRRAGCQESHIFCDTAVGSPRRPAGSGGLLTGVSARRHAGGLAVRSSRTLDGTSRVID